MDREEKTAPGLDLAARDEPVPDWNRSWPGDAIVPGLCAPMTDEEIPGAPSSAPAFDNGDGCEAAMQPASCWPASGANAAAAETGPSVPGIDDGPGLTWS